MKRLLPILFLLTWACSAPVVMPEGLLDRPKFTQVMVEANLIEARLNHEMVIDKRADSPVRAYYTEMFKEQGVTADQFKHTYDHYTAHPSDLKAILEDVLTELQKRKDQAARP